MSQLPHLRLDIPRDFPEHIDRLNKVLRDIKTWADALDPPPPNNGKTSPFGEPPFPTMPPTALASIQAGGGIAVTGSAVSPLVSATGVLQALYLGVTTIHFTDSPYAPLDTDCFIEAFADGGGGTAIDLPASLGDGRVIIVKRMDGGTLPLTVNPNGMDTIDGVNDASLSTITLQYASLAFISAGLGRWDLW